MFEEKIFAYYTPNKQDITDFNGNVIGTVLSRGKVFQLGHISRHSPRFCYVNCKMPILQYYGIMALDSGTYVKLRPTSFTKRVKEFYDMICNTKGWNSYCNDVSTTSYIKKLVELGLIEINNYQQFRRI